MTCPFYRVDKIVTERRRHPRGAAVATVPTISAPWCAHLYSPVPKFMSTRVVGGANKLACGGDLDKCAIPPLRQPKG